MAQVLKEAQRARIIASATDEFVENGVAKASMRGIADNAGTTVSNLYKYYKNKDELIKAVLMPTLCKFTGFEELLSNGSDMVECLISSHDERKLDEFLCKLSDNLVETQAEYPKELYIVVNDERLNDDYNRRFSNLIADILAQTRTEYSGNRNALDILSKMIANSVFYGLRQGVILKYRSDISTEEFKEIVREYLLHSFSILKSINREAT